MGKMAGKRRSILTIGLVLILALICNVPVYAAQDPSFRLDMDSLNLRRGVSTSLVITLENARGAQIVNIEGLDNFDVMSQSSSSSTSVINGVATNQDLIYFTIMPIIEGQFVLKANVQFNGKTYETNELYVTVNDGSGYGNDASPDVFIETTLSHTDAYLGEKIVMTYALYTRYSIEDFSFSDDVYLDGMIIQEMRSGQVKAEYAYLDGERYAVYEVSQFLLDPLKPYVFTIPSYNFRVDVLTDGGMGGGFFRTTTPMYIQTQEKQLTVKPLPLNGKPDDFSGIVGELQIDGSYSADKIRYGESFSLSVIASGACNLDGFKNIVNVETPGFSVYESLLNTEESVNDGQYHVQKKFNAIFVPEITGTIEIPTINISYFNPTTSKYEVARIPGVSIEVIGDMSQQTGGNTSQLGSMETIRVEQVNYSDTSEGYFSIQMKKELVYWILAALGTLLAIVAVFLVIRAKRKRQDSTLKSLYKQIMLAKDVNEIYSLLSALTKHCFNLSLKGSSRNTIRSNLPDKALAEQLTDIMDYMESGDASYIKGYPYLRDKAKDIYRTIIKR